MRATSFIALLALGLFACSPRPRQIAFVSDRDGTLEVFLSDTDSTTITRLTSIGSTVYNLSWAPDGRSLFMTVHGKPVPEVWKIAADGSGLTRVTDDPSGATIADVSPDGRHVLLLSKRDTPTGELYEAALDGQITRRITFNEFTEAGAKYTPDHRGIVLGIQTIPPTPDGNRGTAEIFLYAFSDSSLKQLTFSGGFNAVPSVSPVGMTIAFHSISDTASDIWTIRTDGTGLRNLTNGDGECRWPRWSPDGKWIAYTRWAYGHSDVWMMEPDGAGKHAIIVSPARDEIAEFRPR